MKKTIIYAIAGAMGVVGVAETAPQAYAAENAPRSLEQIRQQVRGEAMTSLANGQVDAVRYRGRRVYRGGRHWGPRRYYGGRRYMGPRRYYGGRRYYGPRRYHYRRYRPGIYFGIY